MHSSFRPSVLAWAMTAASLIESAHPELAGAGAPLLRAQYVLTEYFRGPSGSPVIGDFDGDGTLDCAAYALHFSESELFVFLGDGSGSFDLRFALPSNGVAGDFNEDGLDDIASSDYRRISVHFATGAGGFGVRSEIPVDAYFGAIVAVDVNGDHHLDLVASPGSGWGRMVVLRGAGDGTFGAPSPVGEEIYTSSYSFVITGDFNGDSHVDIGLFREDFGFQVYFGDGSGDFGASTSAEIPRLVAAGDVTGDHIDDLIAQDRQVLSVWPGDSSGTFGPRIDTTVDSQWPLSPVVVADFNADGSADVAVRTITESGVELQVRRGNGDGTFQPPFRMVVSGFGRIAVGDVDRDRRPDILMLEATGIGVALNNGDGTFGGSTFPTGRVPAGLAVADFNRDASPDIAIVNGQSVGTITALDGLGDGSFGNLRSWTAGSSLSSVLAVDGDADGAPDLLVTDTQQQTIRFFNGRGDGGFAPGATLATGSNPVRSAMVDVDGDSDLDLLVVNEYSSSISVFLKTAEGFGAKRDYPAGDFVADLAVADLDGDLRPDLFVASSRTYSVSVLSNIGSGGFGPMSQYGVRYSPQCIAAADVDHDSRPDVLVGTGDGEISLLLGDRNGSLLPHRTFEAGVGPIEDLALADFDGDGNLDVAALDHNGSSVVLLLGDGSGYFHRVSVLGVGGVPQALEAVDVNGDGRTDLVVVSNGFGYRGDFVSPGFGVVMLNQRGETPPSLASLLSAKGSSRTADLQWHVATASIPARIYRRTAAGTWQYVATRLPDGAGLVHFIDGDVVPGMRYAYRLGLVTPQGMSWTDAAWIRVPSELAFSIDSVRRDGPNVIFSITLPDENPAALALVDIGGRRIWSAPAPGGPGRHEVRAAVSVRAGVYFAIATLGASRAVRKVALVQ